MKKFLLACTLGAAALSANAVFMLPVPEIVSETNADGKLKITWQSVTDEKISDYHLVVYKIHKATAAEKFVLAQSDFDYIESTGTFTKHEERGAIWDYLPDNPGWYVKSPLYMNKAMGLDTFNNFAGSDNSDIFGGVYMVSPDYDLSGMAEKAVNVTCELAREATSVTGGFALYTWSDDWWNEANYDYKPVTGHEHSYSDLSMDKFQTYSETCAPEIFPDRTRVCFYGSGSSALWINSFKVDVDMAEGDWVGYPAAVYVITHNEGENSYEVDLSGDTDNDYFYAYQLRAVRNDFDDSRNITTMRFVSPFTDLKSFVAAPPASIGEVEADNAAEFKVENGMLTVSAAEGTAVEVYTVDGRKVLEGKAGEALAPGTGIFIVKAGSSSAKVII